MYFLSIQKIIKQKIMRYTYEAVSISYSIWTGRSKNDYLEIINERGREGWRFVGFSPSNARPKGVKGMELVFERPLLD